MPAPPPCMPWIPALRARTCPSTRPATTCPCGRRARGGWVVGGRLEGAAATGAAGAATPAARAAAVCSAPHAQGWPGQLLTQSAVASPARWLLAAAHYPALGIRLHYHLYRPAHGGPPLCGAPVCPCLLCAVNDAAPATPACRAQCAVRCAARTAARVPAPLPAAERTNGARPSPCRAARVLPRGVAGGSHHLLSLGSSVPLLDVDQGKRCPPAPTCFRFVLQFVAPPSAAGAPAPRPL